MDMPDLRTMYRSIGISGKPSVEGTDAEHLTFNTFFTNSDASCRLVNGVDRLEYADSGHD